MLIFRAITILFLCISCSEPIDLPITGNSKILVIDGIITNEFKNHEIKIGFTVPIDTIGFLPASSLEVKVISIDNNITYDFHESTSGIYKSDLKFSGVINKEYRLEVRKNNGTTFLSEIENMQAPSKIDSIKGIFSTNDSGFDGISVLTYSSPSSSSYFLWKYFETFEIATPLYSYFEWNGSEPVIRINNVSRCWKSRKSNEILVKSSESFSDNRIHGFEVKFIKQKDRVMQTKYSINLYQYSISKKAFDYWNALSKFVKDGGLLNDSQLGNLEGNIHSNNGELSLGYFTVASVDSLRTFFTPDQFEKYIVPDSSECKIELILLENLFDFMNFEFNSNIYSIHDTLHYGPDELDVAWAVVPRECADCTRQGLNIVPEFWLDNIDEND